MRRIKKSWLCRIGLHKWGRGVTPYIERCQREDCLAARTTMEPRDY